jgi:phosphoribosylamine--glycine ligase
MINVLVVGSGGREHTLAWKLSQAPDLEALYCAPGNAGTAEVATNLDVADSDIEGMVKAAREHSIHLVVVGPEAPLALGLADRLRDEGFLVFGPNRAGAQIESSKSWAKAIMDEWGVPTGRATLVSSVDEAAKALDDAGLPVVVKADGLTTGKGVYVCTDRAEADRAVRELIEDEIFGIAGRTVLIEEFLSGVEVSILAVTDGETTFSLLASCDYKRVGDGDAGPNTGGMGAYCPTSAVDAEMTERIQRDVLQPTIDGIRARAGDYRGVLYAGLILTSDGPKVLEFNCRFGDPETQVVLPLLESDFLELCLATARGELSRVPELEWSEGGCVAVVMASQGYPGPYEAGYEIHGLDSLPVGGIAFHAGTAMDGTRVVTAGGRVLAAVGRGPTLEAARDVAYATSDAVRFEGAFRRGDIALREIS